MVFSGMAKADYEAKAAEKLSLVGLGERLHHNPYELSGGQQQRVAIARALANNPPLIIGDEPTGNLDRMSAAVVFSYFHELAEEGATILIVTHDRELVHNVPNVLELADGTIGRTTLEAAAKRRTEELQALRTSLAGE
jgi:putative ABC transport system ATP-binding protein